MADDRIAPVHPGEILLEDVLKPMGISQYRLAKTLGVPAQRIGDIVHGRRAVTADTALRLARAFDMEAPFWLNLQVRYDLEVATGTLAGRPTVAGARIAGDTAQTRSAAYRLAYADEDFMLRDELRPVRLQLELLKPEILLAEHRIDSTVVVFGSARIAAPEAAGGDGPRPGCVLDHRRTYEEARAFARLVSRAGQREGEARRFVVVTGGGPGVMEAANRGAHDVGAASIGLNIVLPEEQTPNPYITPELCFQFHYFAIRKLHFMLRACALVCFPGGFGTLDELFDVLTLIQTGKAQSMPILLFDETYWRRIINFEAMVEEGVIAPKDLDLFCYVESAEQAWGVIAAHCGQGTGHANQESRP